VNHQQLLDNWARWDAATQRDSTAAWLAELAACKQRVASLETQLAPQLDELRRLRDDVDLICLQLDNSTVPGAINWGDLGAAWVARSLDEDNRTRLHVRIEEASPGEDALIVAVRAGLAALGWDVSNIVVETEW